MWRELKIPAVFTLESSFCGANIGELAGLHFTTDHLMDIGRRLCLSLLIFCDIDVPKTVKELNSTMLNKKPAKKGTAPISYSKTPSKGTDKKLEDLSST